MTELMAFKPVGTAFEKAWKLLLEPFDLSLWAKLVLITFFACGGLGSLNPGNSLQYSFDQSDLSRLPFFGNHPVLSDPAALAIVLAVVAFVIALALLLMYLRSVFSFVLVDALTTGNVRVVRPFKENMGRGFKAFLFELLVDLIFGAAIVAIAVAMVLAIFWTLGPQIWEGSLPGQDYVLPSSAVSVLVLVLAVLIGVSVIVFLAIVMGLIVGFFYDFALPLMYFKGAGLRQSVGQVWGMVKRQPLQFIVYVIVRWLLELAIAIAMLIVFMFFFAIFFAIALISAIVMFEAAKSSLLLALPFALALAVGIILLIVVSATISMPIKVYLRYYSLDFLRALEPSYVNYAARFQ